MKSNYTVHYSLLLVVFAHIGALAAILHSPAQPKVIELVPPTIQGGIVSADPIPQPPKPLPPPSPEQKPQPKPPIIPLPKGPVSERAIKQEIQPEPAPPIPVEQKPAEPSALPVTPPHADASQINNPAPSYPAQSRRLREEGVVLLEILVRVDGTVGEIHLKQSSGYTRLDETAIRAVKQWHFLSARRGDEAIDFWYELPIEFSLNH